MTLGYRERDEWLSWKLDIVSLFPYLPISSLRSTDQFGYLPCYLPTNLYIHTCTQTKYGKQGWVQLSVTQFRQDRWVNLCFFVKLAASNSLQFPSIYPPWGIWCELHFNPSDLQAVLFLSHNGGKITCPTTAAKTAAISEIITMTGSNNNDKKNTTTASKNNKHNNKHTQHLCLPASARKMGVKRSVF